MALQDTLTWEAAFLPLDPPGATWSYEVERDGELVWSGTATSCVLATAPGTYTYRLRARRSDGVFAESGLLERTVPLPVLAHSRLDRTVTLSWADLGAGWTYEVRRDGAVLTSGLAALSLVDAALPAGTYAYELRASHAAIGTVAGDPLAVTVPAAPVVVLTGSKSVTTVTLSWTDLGAGWTYEVRRDGQVRSTGGTATTLVEANVPLGAHTWTVQGTRTSDGLKSLVGSYSVVV